MCWRETIGRLLLSSLNFEPSQKHLHSTCRKQSAKLERPLGLVQKETVLYLTVKKNNTRLHAFIHTPLYSFLLVAVMEQRLLAFVSKERKTTLCTCTNASFSLQLSPVARCYCKQIKGLSGCMTKIQMVSLPYHHCKNSFGLRMLKLHHVFLNDHGTFAKKIGE